MSVKIRMTRRGRRHKPFFRISAVESRTPRDGKILEKLGHYDPLEKDAEKQIVLDKERVEYWLGAGAIPSDTVADLLIRKGIKTSHGAERKSRRTKARTIARAKDRGFTKSEKEAKKAAAAGTEEKKE